MLVFKVYDISVTFLSATFNCFLTRIYVTATDASRGFFSISFQAKKVC